MAQVPFFSFISGLHHVVVVLWSCCSRNKPSKSGHPYIDMAKTGNWVRAIDYFFSSSLMLVVTSILFRSPPDVPTLMLVGAVQGSIILIGYLLELIQAGPANAGMEALPNAKGAADKSTGCCQRLGEVLLDNSDIVGPFLASIFVYGVAWASLLIPFGYAVSNAPTAVRVRLPGLQGRL